MSSWDVSGRNDDAWRIEAGETRTLADIKGPGAITHIWMTQGNHYREVLLKITWDNAPEPSILCPLGDFFGLGHGIVNSYQSLFFTASTRANNMFNQGCALNCYLYMPFRERALVELVNESTEPHRQYFYVDHEIYEEPSQIDGAAYLHAEFRRENPFGGWGHEIPVNCPEANIINKERLAWENNYVIMETKGKGHYIGCNISITNFQGTWWGEGDDMIWVDGYKWPPDLHGTGSEDYLNQAWGMQINAFLRNGSSIYENETGGYQTSYVFHVENPVRFQEEIKVTIEHGHGNHLRNEVSSVAYWYADKPTSVRSPPPMKKRLPVRKKNGTWVHDEENQITTMEIHPNEEMLKMKMRSKAKDFPEYVILHGPASRNAEGLICLNIAFSKEPGAPVHEIPVVELLEYFLHKQVTLNLGEKQYQGSLNMTTGGHLEFNVKDSDIIVNIDTKLDELIGKEMEIEALMDLSENLPPGKEPKKFVVNIKEF
ncbi:MAG: glycoside hydrolase family 172 protein [Promethearchaeota archaeon]